TVAPFFIFIANGEDGASRSMEIVQLALVTAGEHGGVTCANAWAERMMSSDGIAANKRTWVDGRLMVILFFIRRTSLTGFRAAAQVLAHQHSRTRIHSFPLLEL